MILRNADAWPEARRNSRELAEQEHKAAELAAQSPEHRLANQNVANRFMAPFSAGQTRRILSAFPELAQALDGEFTGNINAVIAKIDPQRYAPEQTHRYAGSDVEAARHNARVAEANRERANAAVVETSRGAGNAGRGRGPGR